MDRLRELGEDQLTGLCNLSANLQFELVRSESSSPLHDLRVILSQWEDDLVLPARDAPGMPVEILGRPVEEARVHVHVPVLAGVEAPRHEYRTALLCHAAPESANDSFVSETGFCNTDTIEVAALNRGYVVAGVSLDACGPLP